MDFDKYNPLSNDRIAEISKIKKLTAPRFLQLQKYPYQDHQPGDVISPVSKDRIEYYRSFDNIFRELQWFEGREKEELPVYVKSIIHEDVYKVQAYHFLSNKNDCYAEIDHPNGMPAWLSFFLPATEKEYLNRKNQ